MTSTEPKIVAPAKLLRIADLTAAQLNALLDLADEIDNGPSWWTAAPSSTAIACLFDKPSTPTRDAFEIAAHRLGVLAIMLRPDELRLGRGEPLAESARAISAYAAAIVVSTAAHAAVEQLASAAGVPVINAITDDHHPCQALADLLTLRRRFGYLEGIRLAYVGAGSNVAHSLMEAGALAGMHVAIATPPGHGPDHEVITRALALADQHGGEIQVGHDPRAAVDGADAVYTDAWLPTDDQAAYRVDDELMRLAALGAVFMHCQPAEHGLEVTAEVIDGPASIAREQAANRLPTAQAALHLLIGGGHRSAHVTDPAAVRS